MARDKHSAAEHHATDGATEFDAIFGRSDGDSGDDTIISATDETIALLNGAFPAGQSGLDTQALWSLISFG